MLLNGPVLPGSVTVTTASAYSITGGGSIGGTTGLTMSGGGTLTLSTVNSYTGVTTVNGGTIVINNSAALGAVASAADVVVNSGGAIDVGGSTTANAVNFGDKIFKIAGSGPAGAGALVNSSQITQFTAFNFITLTGDATVGGYRMDIGRTPAPATAGVLNLAGHKLTVAMSANGVTTAPQPLFDVLDKVAVIGGGSIEVASGALGFENGATALAANFSAAGIVFDSGSNLQMFRNIAGDITVPMTFKGNNDIGGGSTTGVTPELDSPITLQGNISFVPLASGNPSPGSNESLLAAGNITDNSGGFSVTQAGNNTTTISGTNSWSGGTFVAQGTLKLGSNGALPSGTSATFGNATNGTTGTLDLNGFGATVGALIDANGGTSNVIGNSSTANNSVLTYAGKYRKSQQFRRHDSRCAWHRHQDSRADCYERDADSVEFQHLYRSDDRQWRNAGDPFNWFDRE